MSIAATTASLNEALDRRDALEAVVCQTCGSAFADDEFNGHPCHQPRERETHCRRCMAPTWNVSAICDNCTGKV